MQFDVAIVGAGPAGLAFARALSGCGLRIALVEKAGERDLAAPGFDGREIALTGRSARLLREMGAWQRIPAAEIAPLREARVLNGASGFALRFAPEGRQGDGLGHLVPNHRIRQALFEAVAGLPDITLLAGTAVAAVETGPEAAQVRLADGRDLRAHLVVAADTRFSETRRRQGIGASMRDFGKAMLVCRMAHEVPHEGIATEWFGHGQTIAMLPLNGDLSSAVVTLPTRETDRLLALAPEAFGAEIARRYGHRLGAMQLVGTRHAYPLVAVYAHRFVARRFALVGDAAVGMHPVTAHGFNFGLSGADTLAREIRAALARGQDPADPAALQRYERRHRRATWPLFTATNAIAGLYTDERLPARLLRHAALRLGAALPPVRRLVTARLMEAGPPSLRLAG
ncbi:5-demethoxyubiquinol-8 5-hydroxylase UbiM [Siccirubricoccus sp. G192]|uniref:5-demethoxyubiquinol-8 5-hydroxylase UbiM n=1 Tax=Siccirubricoccus sp. G192 TaxID=2849651 RepID=UPI001C2CB824|nr:5-demethoxyubiquinol-8 5-hydroxylase UbiM [Siccirubricoccus sp. G192]MBV1797344.1 5-demethoxyubiquinol-8 5-hydroxylase UbiM [Siccirubricoccus sp. G192]